MVLRKYKLSTYGDTKRLLGSDDTLPEPLLFTEKLYVFDEKGSRIGRFLLNIDQGSPSTENHILHVHMSNMAMINGRKSETTVSGSITHKLKTLEEIRYETTEVCESNKHERCLFLLRETTKYYLSVTNTVCDYKHHSQMTIPFTNAIGLIGECSNAMLLRKLAFRGYEGILCLKGLLSNGKRCKNYYVTKLSDQVVNGTRMQVLVVYRTMTNHRRCTLTMTMALTRAGQLIYLFWSNSKCFLHIDPDVQLNTHRFTDGSSTFLKNWHKDIQLHSLYLDRVDLQRKTLRTYNTHREELRRVFDDFICYLLFMKPIDIVCFAIEYFTAFGKSTLRKCVSKPDLGADRPITSVFSLPYYEGAEAEEEEEDLWGDDSSLFEASQTSKSTTHLTSSTHGAHSTHRMHGSQGGQSSQGVQSSQGGQSFQGGQSSQGGQSFQGGRSSQGAPSSQGLQSYHGARSSHGVRSTHGVRSSVALSSSTTLATTSFVGRSMPRRTSGMGKHTYDKN